MPRTKYNVFSSLIERYILFKKIFHICHRAMERPFVVLVLQKNTLFVTQKMQGRIIIILDIEWILDIERILELVSTIEYRFHGQRPDVHIVTMH